MHVENVFVLEKSLLKLSKTVRAQNFFQRNVLAPINWAYIRLQIIKE